MHFITNTSINYSKNCCCYTILASSTSLFNPISTSPFPSPSLFFSLFLWFCKALSMQFSVLQNKVEWLALKQWCIPVKYAWPQYISNQEKPLRLSRFTQQHEGASLVCIAAGSECTTGGENDPAPIIHGPSCLPFAVTVTLRELAHQEAAELSALQSRTHNLPIFKWGEDT